MNAPLNPPVTDPPLMCKGLARTITTIMLTSLLGSLWASHAQAVPISGWRD